MIAKGDSELLSPISHKICPKCLQPNYDSDDQEYYKEQHIKNPNVILLNDFNVS